MVKGVFSSFSEKHVEFLLMQSVIHPCFFFCESSLFDPDNDNDRELRGPDSHALLVSAGGGCLRSRSVGSCGSRHWGH